MTLSSTFHDGAAAVSRAVKAGVRRRIVAAFASQSPEERRATADGIRADFPVRETDVTPEAWAAYRSALEAAAATGDATALVEAMDRIDAELRATRLSAARDDVSDREADHEPDG